VLFLKLTFCQAWKADLSLQLTQEPETVVCQLQQAWKQPGITDIRLLSYIYRLLAEATRRQQDNGQPFSSVGTENEKVWQDAAKALGHKEERKELWSELGRVSLREECWEDFRKVCRCISSQLIDIDC
jgi:N-terminal acetyltransferase B complex non-catalytic subunit